MAEFGDDGFPTPQVTMYWRGTWASTSSYRVGDVVRSGSALFIARRPSAAVTPASYSLWGGATPNTPSANNGAGGNFSTEFSSSVDGLVTALAFYKGTSQTGTHSAAIYDKNAASLLTAVTTYAGESASGWQTQSLAAPLWITASTHYLIVIHTTDNFISYGTSAPTPTGSLSVVSGNHFDFNGSIDDPTANTGTANIANDIVFTPSPAVWTLLANA